ncbi:hypothetical protein [Lacinutrix jangbogonensis]|uniref:hypothetical protein n=1 Tax=Lacinutrix jangbogonensis TaxID=1469557 RepID=UPI00053DCB85|nr:hypothetical protein [Lacinutrix jangbogonensis]
MLLITAVHIKLLFKYRKNNPKSKFSVITLLGGLIIPLLFVLGLMFSSFLIDYFIGVYASGRSSYGVFYSFLLLPKYWLYYLVFVFILDFIFKKQSQKKFLIF